MKCEECQPLISIYVDEALDDPRTMEMFSHLSGCPACRGFMRGTLDIRSAIASQPRPVLPLRGRQFTFAAADAGNRSLRSVLPGRRSIWSRRISLPISLAASIVIFLLAGLVGLTSLWMNTGDRERAQVVYMTRMPVVQVYATPPANPVTPQ